MVVGQWERAGTSSCRAVMDVNVGLGAVLSRMKESGVEPVMPFYHATESATAPPATAMILASIASLARAVFGPVESIWRGWHSGGLRPLQNAPVSLPAEPNSSPG